MRIVADRNIAFVAEAFAGLGEVVALPAAALTPAAVRDADLLLVRSTVRVGAPLLDDSRVRFVATATIGIDHLDVPWLEARGITWAAAPGSNADSVVQWFAAAMACVPDLERRQLGIVGVGNVGGRIERLWRALDVAPPLLCDPPRARRAAVAGVSEAGDPTVVSDQRRENGPFVGLDELLARADLVTLHVPLVQGGEDATGHLLDARRLRPGAWLVNSSRGEVLDSATVFAVDNPLLLDVFAGEPAPDARLVARARLATPHIAGHSLDGKANGTKMIYDAACAFLGAAPIWTPALPPVGPAVIARRDDGVAAALEAVAAGYQPGADHDALARMVAAPDGGAAFRRYREQYPVRRELDGRVVQMATPLVDAIRMLNAYGVRVEPNR
jgi:erythronate-4-phosphate dehydrogenase